MLKGTIQVFSLIGKNGVGKTTIIKLLVGDESHQGGELELGHNISVGYFAQDEAEKLDGNKTIFETIDDIATGVMRTKVRNILGSFLFSGEDQDKKVKVLSGGEKGRLALCKLLLEPYNFLVLDFLKFCKFISSSFLISFINNNPAFDLFITLLISI